MTPDQYLVSVLARHRVDTGILSPLRKVQTTVEPALKTWGGVYIVGIMPSGSFAKGTAIQGGTDIDIFVSLTSTLTTSLEQIYLTLDTALTKAGYLTRRQNVSIGLSVGGYKVDITPGRRHDQWAGYHSLYSNKSKSWIQTDINRHIKDISSSNRLDEIRLTKIWRNRFGIDWPSFYLELFVIDALRGLQKGNLSSNMITVFSAIRHSIPTARFADPSNTNNIVSDVIDLTSKERIRNAAIAALASTWENQFG